MPKYLFALLLISLYPRAVSQQRFVAHGTIIVAAITDDGIILAADSRGCFSGIAYFDSTIKICKVKQFMVGFAGAASIGNKYVYQIVDSFNATNYSDTSLRNTLVTFSHYLDTHFPIRKFPERNSIELLGVGYVNGQPKIVAMDSAREGMQDAGMMVSDVTALKYFNNSRGSSIYKAIENAIYNYANSEHKTNTVGGPISIVKVISNNNVIWIQNNFSARRFAGLQDFYEHVKNDKVPLHCLMQNCKVELLRRMRH
jgi:hypothetical protein